MPRKASLLVLLALAAAPGLARADAKTEAQSRFQHAIELHEAGKFAEALNELTVAYTLDPRPEVLYAIGQMHVRLGDCPQAILFYQRFLSTSPDAVPAAAAAEAIETCKTKPDAAAKAAAAAPAPPPAPAAHAPSAQEQPARWYTDKLGAGLLGSGVLVGAAGIATYVSARADLADADAALDHQHHADLVDSAHNKRTYAVVLGAVGAGLATAAVVRYALVRRATARTTVGAAPAPGGGLVTWSGRF
jgi:tetratricopeptide (TPR) repeat protein